jgi:alginate O-acetyltransferase complex protein AlgI
MEQILRSAKLFLLGFLKKIAIADNLGLLVNRVFQLESPSLLLGFTGALGFSVQLFADFSAYTDISRGVSILMGFDPPKNFNAPFLATSPQDFWNRWHITLSSWLRTYIFNPVRRKLIRVWPKARPIHVVIPALAAMLASGLWHGNTSRFLIWGLYQGIILIVFRGAEKQLKTFIPMREFPFLKWILTFVLMMIGWLLFRGRSASWALDIIFNSRPGFSGDEFVTAVSILSMIFMYSIPLMLYRLIDYSGKIKRVLEPAYFLLALVVLVVFSASGVQDFLYFEF